MNLDFSKIESIEYDKNRDHIFGIKSGIVWAHEGGKTFPLCYISKPRWMSEIEFNEVLDRLIINVKK